MKSGMPAGVTLIEALIGMFIFVAIALPLLRFAASSSDYSKPEDLRIACAILRGETAVMYGNQKLAPSRRFVTIDNAVYEVSDSVVMDSLVANWSMTVKKAGKTIAGVHGLLYVDSHAR